MSTPNAPMTMVPFIFDEGAYPTSNEATALKIFKDFPAKDLGPSLKWSLPWLQQSLIDLQPELRSRNDYDYFNVFQDMTDKLLDASFYNIDDPDFDLESVPNHLLIFLGDQVLFELKTGRHMSSLWVKLNHSDQHHHKFHLDKLVWNPVMKLFVKRPLFSGDQPAGLPLQVFYIEGNASEAITLPIPFEVVSSMPAELGGSKIMELFLY